VINPFRGNSITGCFHGPDGVKCAIEDVTSISNTGRGLIWQMFNGASNQLEQLGVRRTPRSGRCDGEHPTIEELRRAG
jgi:hypothetical protein